MKKAKKWVAGLLACVLLLSTTACGSGSGNSSSSGELSSTGSTGEVTSQNAGGEEGSDEVVTVNLRYSVATIPPLEEAITGVEDAISEYCQENGYNLALDFDVTTIAEYQTAIPLGLSSGEEMGIIMVTNQQDFVNNGYLVPLQDYLDNELAGINELEGDWLVCGTTGGNLYSIPCHKGWVLTYKWIYDTQYTDGINLDKSQITDFDSLMPVFEQLHAAYPDVYIMPDTSSLPGFFNEMMETSLIGTYFATVGDDPTLVNYFETEAFQRSLEIAYQFRQNGWVSDEGSASSLAATDMFFNGVAMSEIWGHGNTEESTAEAYDVLSTVGAQYDAIELGVSTAMTTLGINYGVAYTCPDPAAAAQMLDLMWTDEFVMNTMIYGLEGRDYVWNDDHTAIRFPDGVDTANSEYNCYLNSAIFGNQLTAYPFEGYLTVEDQEYMQENIDNARYAPLFGFSPDATNVSTQLAAVSNVYNQYYNALIYGDVDPDVVLPEFLSALEAAGINDILTEYQTQVTQWLENQ